MCSQYQRPRTLQFIQFCCLKSAPTLVGDTGAITKIKFLKGRQFLKRGKVGNVITVTEIKNSQFLQFCYLKSAPTLVGDTGAITKLKFLKGRQFLKRGKVGNVITVNEIKNSQFLQFLLS